MLLFAEKKFLSGPERKELLRPQISELQSQGEENDGPLKQGPHHFKLWLSLKQMHICRLVKRSIICSQRG